MNSPEIRKYFVDKFRERFDSDYPRTSIPKEASLIKRILTDYPEDVILESIDIFLKETPKKDCSISLLFTRDFFERNFYFIIKLKDIIHFRRASYYYKNSEHAIETRKLFHEYIHYVSAISLNPEDIERKKEILEILRGIEDAERTGRTYFNSSEGQR